jgi:hypothetical protein
MHQSGSALGGSPATERERERGGGRNAYAANAGYPLFKHNINMNNNTLLC